jgi:hypothetical protein
MYMYLKFLFFIFDKSSLGLSLRKCIWKGSDSTKTKFLFEFLVLN